jgi:myo-inositol-1(or 4)-monophosphatase
MMSQSHNSEIAELLAKPAARDTALQSVAEDILHAVVELQPFVLDTFRNPTGVVLKDDQSIVTFTDKEVERRLRVALESKIEGSYFLGEESSGLSVADCEAVFDKPFVWLGDPIDGTSNFSRGIPEFGISMGMYEGSEGVLSPAIGAIFQPNTGELFYTDGTASFVQDVRTGAALRITPGNERAAVQPVVRIGDLVGKRFEFTPGESPIAMQLVSCTVTDLAYVAAGRATAAVTASHLWDFAAGVAIGKPVGVHFWNLETGEPKSSFTAADFILDDPDNRWMTKETFVFCSESNLKQMQNLFRVR